MFATMYGFYSPFNERQVGGLRQRRTELGMAKAR